VTPDQLRRRLADFAVEIRRVATPLFSKPESRDDAAQLTRAASSAAAMHRAAGRARSHREFTSTIAEALEEADETVFWLNHLIACKDLSPSEVKPQLDEACQLVAILTASHATAKAKDAKATTREPSRRKPRPRR